MMRLILLVMFCLMLAGCAKPGVRCDAHLEPINAPAARTSLPGGGASAAPRAEPEPTADNSGGGRQ
jgi:hypothetical protein